MIDARLDPPSRRSIRVRLLLLALLPLGIVLPALLVILATWGGGHIDDLLVAKVRTDLAAARGYYDRVAEGVGRSVEALAGSAQLAGALASSDGERRRGLPRGTGGAERDG